MEIKKFDKEGLIAFKSVKKIRITGFHLKMLAVIAMLIDHFAYLYVSNDCANDILRGIGRLSFPIYCFLVVEGFFKTTNINKYLKRLLVFAIISEIPYDVAFAKQWIYSGKSNVFWTLLIGLITIWCVQYLSDNKEKLPKALYSAFGEDFIMTCGRLAVVGIACGVAYFIKSSYSYAGVLLIYMFYAFYQSHVGKVFSNFFFNIVLFSGLQSWGFASSIFIAMYNGERGNDKFKRLFYWIYPLHLIVFVIIKILLIRIN